jgi:hypothetical protein
LAQRALGFALEPSHVDIHIPAREQLDPVSPKHERVLVAQCAPGVMGSLAQVGGPGRCVEVGPQLLDRPVTR